MAFQIRTVNFTDRLPLAAICADLDDRAVAQAVRSTEDKGHIIDADRLVQRISHRIAYSLVRCGPCIGRIIAVIHVADRVSARLVHGSRRPCAGDRGLSDRIDAEAGERQLSCFTAIVLHADVRIAVCVIGISCGTSSIDRNPFLAIDRSLYDQSIGQICVNARYRLDAAVVDADIFLWLQRNGIRAIDDSIVITDCHAQSAYLRVRINARGSALRQRVKRTCLGDDPIGKRSYGRIRRQSLKFTRDSRALRDLPETLPYNPGCSGYPYTACWPLRKHSTHPADSQLPAHRCSR